MIVCFKGRIKTFAFIFLIGLCLVFNSCKKREDTVGSDFVGSIVGFNVQSIDTATLVAYTTLGESISTRFAGTHFLGKMNDPELGTTTASIITQYSLLLGGNIWTNNNINIDSIVLQVKYLSQNSFYGNANTVQRFNVYELNEDLLIDSAYKSDRVFAYNSSKILGSTFTNFARMTDSVKYTLGGKQITLPGHLRINLNDAGYIQKFETAPSSTFSTAEAFQAYFKGLVITAETNPLTPGEGSIAFLDLRNNSGVTSVVVYYNDSLKIEFPIFNENNIRLNKFEHSVSSTIQLQPKTSDGPRTHQNITYAQGLGGIKTRILIPYLADFVKNQNIALSSAEVTFTVASNFPTDVYKPSPALNLFDSDKNGLNVPIRDFNLIRPDRSVYGGILSNNQYKFNITNHVQNLLTTYRQTGKIDDFGLNLFVPTENPYRVILDTSPGKIKLKLNYAVIK
jgi:hypothetical protein